MNKVILPVILILLMASGQPHEQAVQQSTSDDIIKDSVTALMNRYHRSMLNKDADGLLATISDQGLILGTDPDEAWHKDELRKYLVAPFSDSSKFQPYTVIREVRPGPDGKTALAIEQYIFTQISSRLPVRGIAYVVKEGGRWQIDTYSLSIIPENEDLARINQFFSAIR